PPACSELCGTVQYCQVARADRMGATNAAIRLCARAAGKYAGEWARFCDYQRAEARDLHVRRRRSEADRPGSQNISDKMHGQRRPACPARHFAAAEMKLPGRALIRSSYGRSSLG